MADDSSFGQSSLAKSRFFLNRLVATEQTEPFDPVAAEAYLEAAILFGKNLQYAIEGRVPDKKKTKHWNDPKCEFVSKLRDVIVHEDGSAEVTASTSVTVNLSGAAIGVSGATAFLTVSPSNPSRWQRIMMLIQVPVDNIRRWLAANRDRRRMRQLRERLQKEAAERAPNIPPTSRTTKVHFTVSDSSFRPLVDAIPEIESCPAAEVILHYLGVLETELLEIRTSP
jgi:hypothetical protein